MPKVARCSLLTLDRFGLERSPWDQPALLAFNLIQAAGASIAVQQKEILNSVLHVCIHKKTRALNPRVGNIFQEKVWNQVDDLCLHCFLKSVELTEIWLVQ